MRSHTVALLFSAAVLVAGTFNRPAIAGDREVFQFRSGETEGALIHDYADRWLEYGGPVERFSFTEVARTDDVIELLDAPRDVGLKVYADHGDLRLPKSTAWQPWARGTWTKRDQLPDSIKFVPTDQKIRLVYFVPKDREPIAQYEQKIRVVMQMTSEFFRDDLRAKGIRTDGPSIEADVQGEPMVHLIRTEKNAQYYNGAPNFDDIRHFQTIASDIPAAVGTIRRHMVVLFAETYEPGPAPIEWNGSVGRGVHVTADGGLAVMSSWILRDEFCSTTFDQQKKLIFDPSPIEGRTALGPRKLSSPRFEFIEDGFGAVMHELGHALGLPHDYRQPNDLMGHGFRSLQVNYLPNRKTHKLISISRENARLLETSRYLIPKLDVTDTTKPTADLSIRIVKGAMPSVILAMQAKDDRDLHAVVFVDTQNDTVIGGAELKGREQELNLKLPLKGIKAGEFKLSALLADANGNIAQLTASANSQ